MDFRITELHPIVAICGGLVIQLEHGESGLASGLTFEAFHGFFKATVPAHFTEEIIASYSYGALQSKDVQVEVVRLENDLSSEIHTHHRTTAAVMALGKKHGFVNPKKSEMFFYDKWERFTVSDGITLIHPKVKHGFRVKAGGILYFLSVQNPPIIGENGTEDYNRC